ncbi:putative RNA helicase [Helianthus debilis subsp. tardiflorus]
MELALENIMSISQEGTVKEYCDSFQILFDQFDISITLEELMKDNELFRNGKIQETCDNIVQETIVDEVIDYVHKTIKDESIQDECSEDNLYGEMSKEVGNKIQELSDGDDSKEQKGKHNDEDYIDLGDDDDDIANECVPFCNSLCKDTAENDPATIKKNLEPEILRCISDLDQENKKMKCRTPCWNLQMHLLLDYHVKVVNCSAIKELVHKIYLEAKNFAKECSNWVSAAYGGISKFGQFKSAEQCETVIDTPGRLIELLWKLFKKICEKSVLTFVDHLTKGVEVKGSHTLGQHSLIVISNYYFQFQGKYNIEEAMG